MMEICDNWHDSIVHEDRSCPLCEVNREVEKLEERLETLENEINEQ
tara:strand:+ start:209 stop:346 length:138 start_codon:yes stop_codon:yes gene_type:complete